MQLLITWSPPGLTVEAGPVARKRPSGCYRFLIQVAVVVLVSTLNACSTHPQAGMDICGYHIAAGQGDRWTQLLQTAGPQPPVSPSPPPARSRLPPITDRSAKDRADAAYVRVGRSCEHGAIVVVTPAKSAHVVDIVPARDGKPVVVGFRQSDDVTVQSWVSGRYQGALDLSDQ